MAFPSEEELKKIRKKLEKAEPSHDLPENPTKSEVLKYELCRKFVRHLIRKNGLTQAELARQLEMDPARLNEIVRYRIDLFTIDKLFEFAQRLDPSIELKIVE